MEWVQVCLGIDHMFRKQVLNLFDRNRFHLHKNLMFANTWRQSGCFTWRSRVLKSKIWGARPKYVENQAWMLIWLAWAFFLAIWTRHLIMLSASLAFRRWLSLGKLKPPQNRILWIFSIEDCWRAVFHMQPRRGLRPMKSRISSGVGEAFTYCFRVISVFGFVGFQKIACTMWVNILRDNSCLVLHHDKTKDAKAVFSWIWIEKHQTPWLLWAPSFPGDEGEGGFLRRLKTMKSTATGRSS